jgi:hypothetical protein
MFPHSRRIDAQAEYSLVDEFSLLYVFVLFNLCCQCLDRALKQLIGITFIYKSSKFKDKLGIHSRQRVLFVDTLSILPSLIRSRSLSLEIRNLTL